MLKDGLTQVSSTFDLHSLVHAQFEKSEGERERKGGSDKWGLLSGSAEECGESLLMQLNNCTQCKC